jgi:hypothetical protein
MVVKLDRKFLGRLGTYLIGVAIGLALLGVLQMARRQAIQPPPGPVHPAPSGQPR